MCIQSITIWISFGSRWLRLREVWYIVANPAALCAIPIVVLGVPPEIFLAFRPRLAIRVSRGAVVDYMAVGRPGKAPVEADILVAMAVPCQVLPLFRHNAAENPDTAGGATIRFELRKVFDHLAISDCITVDLFHDIFDHGFLQWALAAIIPGQILNGLVTLLRTVLVKFFQADIELRQEPVLRTGIIR